jgi:hypothetical protein
MSAALAHLSASIERSRFPALTKVIIKGLPLQFFFCFVLRGASDGSLQPE